jgi:phosphohistidine phosphatase
LDANLPTSGVVVIDFKIDDWDDIGFRGGELSASPAPRSC